MKKSERITTTRNRNTNGTGAVLGQRIEGLMDQAAQVARARSTAAKFLVTDEAAG